LLGISRFIPGRCWLSYSGANKTKNTDYLLAYNIGVMAIAVEMPIEHRLETEIQANSKQAISGGFGADRRITPGFHFGVVTKQTGCVVQGVIQANGCTQRSTGKGIIELM
jgi:hypothetical protein